jgi:hypothetical protein
MATEKRLIPLSKRIVYAGDVFNSLMAEKKWAATEAADFIKEFRTVDAVKVVRCKNCKEKCEYSPNQFYCFLSGLPIDEDDFCSFGAKMDGEGNG